MCAQSMPQTGLAALVPELRRGTCGQRNTAGELRNSHHAGSKPQTLPQSRVPLHILARNSTSLQAAHTAA